MVHQYPSSVPVTLLGCPCARRGLFLGPLGQPKLTPVRFGAAPLFFVSAPAGQYEAVGHLLCCLLPYRDKHTGYPLVGITVVLGLG